MPATHRYSIESLPESAVSSCVDLSLASLQTLVPLAEHELRSALSGFLRKHVAADAAVAARDGEGTLVGFAAFDSFPFHGEQAAFCPLAGHWAAADDPSVYEAIYTALAARWVREGVRKHLFSIPAASREVERRFFEIGFGRYVVDALMPIGGHGSNRPTDDPAARSLDSARPPPGVTVRAATPADLDALKVLTDESISWYAASPIFLAFEPTPLDELRDLLSSQASAVFLAEDAGGPIGFMGVSRNEGINPILLIGPQSATLDGIGAYLKPTARNNGTGAALLARCREWARHQGLTTLHVDFESANPAARSFWPRYFTPRVHSLMRLTHADSPN